MMTARAFSVSVAVLLAPTATPSGRGDDGAGARGDESVRMPLGTDTGGVS